MLLRHWNLYDSMYYSNYIASKLKVWRVNYLSSGVNMKFFKENGKKVLA